MHRSFPMLVGLGPMSTQKIEICGETHVPWPNKTIVHECLAQKPRRKYTRMPSIEMCDTHVLSPKNGVIHKYINQKAMRIDTRIPSIEMCDTHVLAPKNRVAQKRLAIGATRNNTRMLSIGMCDTRVPWLRRNNVNLRSPHYKLREYTQGSRLTLSSVRVENVMSVSQRWRKYRSTNTILFTRL